MAKSLSIKSDEFFLATLRTKSYKKTEKQTNKQTGRQLIEKSNGKKNESGSCEFTDKGMETL